MPSAMMAYKHKKKREKTEMNMNEPTKTTNQNTDHQSALWNPLGQLPALRGKPGGHDIRALEHVLDGTAVNLHLGHDVGVLVQGVEGGEVGTVPEVEEEDHVVDHHQIQVVVARKEENKGSQRRRPRRKKGK